MMSKKIYKEFAEIITTRREEIHNLIDNNADPRTIMAWEDRENELDTVTRNIATIFADDNPNFDRERFLKACGLS